MPKKQEENFEVVLEKLRGIVRDLEEGDAPLEDSLKQFEEGMELAKVCQNRLNSAEQKIEELVSANRDGVETKPFKS